MLWSSLIHHILRSGGEDNGEVFNPREKLLPDFFEKDGILKDGQFILKPVFLGNYQYGYLICKLRRASFGVNSIVLKVLTTVLAQSYDYTKTLRRAKSIDSANQMLTTHNIDLKIKSSTDELTGA